MKKAFIVFLAIAMALPLAAADFGFSVDSYSSLEDRPVAPFVGFTEIVRLSSFLSLKSGKAFKLNAAGYADLGYSSFAAAPFAFDGNLDRFELTLSPLPASAKASLAIRAGRVRASDPAALIGIKRLDGLQADYSKDQVDLGLDCGYLGLLSEQEMRVLLSGPDIAEYKDSSHFFAPPRIYSALRARFVELFLGQDLQALVASQADLRQTSADVVHSEYAEFLLEGPLFIGFDYQLGGVFELVHRMAQANKTELAGSAKLKLGWSEPAALNSKANILVVWTSGSGGSFSTYAPVCSDTAGDSFEIVDASLVRYKLVYSITPARGLTIGADAIGFMRSSFTDEPEDAQYISGTTQLWLGEEFGGSLSYEPLSDLHFELKGSCFLPAKGLTFQADAAPRWNASLIATIDF